MTIRIAGSTVPAEGRYGAPRQTGGKGSSYPHRGIDHYAPRGTPIVSREGGRVVSRGRTPDSTTGSYGFWSLIDYGTHQTLIAHLDNAGGAGKGQAVVEGGILGYVGNSGNARFGGTHCHEEARLGGVAVDPARFYPVPGNTSPASSSPGSVAVAWQGIQEMLRALYGYTGKIDGVPGKGTWAAMQRFLAKSWAYRGPIDGVASKGGATWKAASGGWRRATATRARSTA
jgi:murein DD-endopeptidase